MFSADDLRHVPLVLQLERDHQGPECADVREGTTAKHTGHRHPVREDENEEAGDCAADEQHPAVVGFEPAPRVVDDFTARAFYRLR